MIKDLSHVYPFTGFPGGAVVKKLPAVWETWVPSQGWEDPLEKQMATHSSTLAWEIPWMGNRQATVHGTTELLALLIFFQFLKKIWEADNKLG